MINVMVGIGLYGAMLVVVFKSPTMMAKNRIEGVAERIVLVGTVHAAVQRAAANFSRRRTVHSAVLQQLGAQSAFDTGGGWSFTCLQLAHTLGNLLSLQVKAFRGESCWLESGYMRCEGEVWWVTGEEGEE